MHKIMSVIIYSVILTSCSYSVYSTGYPHLKTIAVLPFENSTTEYQIENELFLDISERFEQDGRLSIVTMSPDCQLEGKILDYSDKIYSYNVDGIEEYQVKILFSVIFTDLKKNEVIFQNDTLVMQREYSSADPEAEFGSEEEARTKIYNDLFDRILKETLEKW
jgi:lipopolysaccharide assembly LptE-like protein